MKKPPLNILIIVTDDQGAQAGYLGTQGVKTPTMDLLAKEGVAFAKAYCTFPSCSPSRAGLLIKKVDYKYLLFYQIRH